MKYGELISLPISPWFEWIFLNYAHLLIQFVGHVSRFLLKVDSYSSQSGSLINVLSQQAISLRKWAANRVYFSMGHRKTIHHITVMVSHHLKNLVLKLCVLLTCDKIKTVFHVFFHFFIVNYNLTWTNRRVTYATNSIAMISFDLVLLIRALLTVKIACNFLCTKTSGQFFSYK